MGRVPIPRPSFLDGCASLGYVYGERRWRTPDGMILTWDGRHGEIEAFDRYGHHVSVLDPMTGVEIKPGRKGRRIRV
jgi:hypothetical protein